MNLKKKSTGSAAVKYKHFIYIVGGGEQLGYDVWRIDAKEKQPKLTKVDVSGSSPPQRTRSRAVLAGPSKNLMFVYGGYTADNKDSFDVWCLNLDTRKWTKVKTDGQPNACTRGALMASHSGTALWWFGGGTGGRNASAVDSFWKLELDDKKPFAQGTWKDKGSMLMKPTYQSLNSTGVSMSIKGREYLVVYSGHSSRFWVFDVQDGEWTRLSAAGFETQFSDEIWLGADDASSTVFVLGARNLRSDRLLCALDMLGR